jgi:hypothetical protein
MITVTGTSAGAAPGTPALTKAVSAAGVMDHLDALQKIADGNGDTPRHPAAGAVPRPDAGWNT